MDGYPPLTANIRRKRFFDIPKTRFHTDTRESFVHPIEKLSKVVKQKQCCSNSWVIAPVSCLGDLYGLRDGTNPELDSSFVVSCYAAKNFSKYYTECGCNGDSMYNAIYFLYVNGTVKDVCWESSNFLDPNTAYTEKTTETPKEPEMCSRVSLRCKDPELYKLGESDLPGKNPDAFNISAILNSKGELVWPEAKGSKPISKDTAIGYLKYMVAKGPVVAGFLVLEGFLTPKGADWATGTYVPNQKDKIVGYHCAVIVGWGPGYWVLRNSWGTDWAPSKDVPPGYWRHAMYSEGMAIGLVDVSVAGDHPSVSKLPHSVRADPLGGAISMGISSMDMLETLNIGSIRYAPYIRDSKELYPQYVWVVFFVILILLSAKVLL